MIKDFFREDLKNFIPYEGEKNECRIKLDANESPIILPNGIENEIMKAVKNSLLNRYPDPSSVKVCSLYAEYAGVSCKNIMAGNGSDELIQIITNAFISKGDKAVTINPDFSMYGIYTKIAGGDVVEYELNEEFNGEADSLVSMVNNEKPRVLFLSNPNNPTGGVMPEGDLIKIISGCNCIVVIDEAYYEFYGETVCNRVNEFKNLIVLRTCSKALGLAGVRLGFLITGDVLMNELKKVKPPFNVNIITQEVASVILENKSLVSKNVESVLAEKEYIYRHLKKFCGLKLYPSKANFILVESGRARDIKNRLLTEGISVRSYGSGRLKNCLRITVGNRMENDALIGCLTGSLASGEDL